MDASANPKQQWTPEVAAKLRGAMIAFVVVLLLSMVTTIAYVAGRTLSVPVPDRTYAEPSPAPKPEPLPRHVEAPTPRPTAIPEVAVRQTPPVAVAQAAVPDPSPDKPVAVDKPVAADTLVPPEVQVPTPQPGRYLQVGAVEFASAEKIVEKINRTGLAAVVAPGPSERIFRVVVGPLDSAEMAAKTHAALAGKGYQTFPRRY